MSAWDAPAIGPFAQLLTADKLDEHANSRDLMAVDALNKARRWPTGSDQYRRWTGTAAKHEELSAQYRSLANQRRGGGPVAA